MLRRIIIYLFGVALGCVLVYFMLIKDRDRDLGGWLPEKRILAEIEEYGLTYSDRGECQLQCLSIDKKSIEKILADGNVNFKESETRKEPKIYWIEGESLSGKQLWFKVKIGTQKAELVEVSYKEPAEECNC